MKFVIVSCFASFFLALNAYKVNHVDEVSHATAENHIESWTILDSLENENVLHVEYRCSKMSMIFVQVQVQTESQTNYPILKKKFECVPFEEKKRRIIKLKYARYISFKPDFYNKYSLHVDEASVKIWMVEADKIWVGYSGAVAKKELPLKVVPPFERPIRILDKCPVWWYEIKSRNPYSPMCILEEEVVQILSYPLALDGRRIGLVKAFSPYKSKVLEKNRMNKNKSYGFSVMFWVYIVDYCPDSNLCSLMHHATWDDNLITPLFLINKRGQIHVEMTFRNSESLAFLTSDDFFILKEEWVQLVFACNLTNVWTLHMRTISDRSPWKTTKIEIPTSTNIYYNDANGIFYFGGSELQPSFRGYFGEIVFYRRHVINPLQTNFDPKRQHMFNLELKEKTTKCRKYRNKVHYIQLRAEALQQKIMWKKSCSNFQKWLYNLIEQRKPPQCKIEDSPKINEQYKFVKDIVHSWVFTGKVKRFPDLALLLVDQAYDILDQKGLEGVPNVISLLKQSSCFGNHDASFMLSTIINYGLYVKVNLIQSHAYLLSGSIYSNRLCLLSMANKHVFGLDGIPLDLEQAYVYYMNSAYLTKDDLLKHDDRDTITEAVRLTDEVTVKAQTGEEEDLFMWLKHQASKGMIDAQKRLAGMLYWGSQGVKRNKSSASTYYEAAALSGDATAIYDFGILLLKGHGVKRNITKALEHFKMAAEKKHAQSINTLGWYALVYEHNYTEAANYFEEAFRLGNPDAGHNLAHMLLSGTFPELNRIERVLAWDFFSKAALGGNFDSGLLVARYNMIGHPRTIRSPALSVEWARYLAEQNPVIGKLLKNGLTSFRKQNWPAALVYYLMAASTGVEVANFNLAFLCEENYEYLTTSMQKECTWRHYNLSSLRSSESSNPYAWLKMADYHYMNHNISMAATTYAEAAANGDPQAFFSLATMIENHDRVPDNALKILGISFSTSRNTENLLKHLYTRCRDSNNSDAFIPCSLALWRVKIYYFWIRHDQKIIGIIIVSMTFVILSILARAIRYVHSPRLTSV